MKGTRPTGKIPNAHKSGKKRRKSFKKQNDKKVARKKEARSEPSTP